MLGVIYNCIGRKLLAYKALLEAVAMFEFEFPNLVIQEELLKNPVLVYAVPGKFSVLQGFIFKGRVLGVIG